MKDTVVKQKRGAFNLVDAVLLAVAAITVALAVLFLDPFSLGIFQAEEESVTLSYTVCISGVDAVYLNKISEGDTVLDAVTRASLGNVSAAITEQSHQVLRYDERLGGVMQTVPETYDVWVTVTAEGAFEKGIGYKVAGKRIAVGREYTLLFPNFAGKGYCTAIREIPQEGL